MPSLIRSYVRFTDRISDYVGYLAAALIFVMGATLMFDAFTRNVINIPLHWCIELRSSPSRPITSWAGHSRSRTMTTSAWTSSTRRSPKRARRRWIS